MPSPKLVPLVLTDDERGTLQALARKRKISQALAERAKIVLACAENAGTEPVTAVAARFGVSREMIRKWRSRFLEKRLDGLADAPRPGAPRKITDEQVEVVVTKTLTEKGRGQDTHWSTRSMAAEAGMIQTAISRIWRAFGLKPHLTETWKLSTDPSSSTRSATWSACTCPRRRTRWSWRSTRRARSRRLTGPRHACPCSPRRRNG